MIMGDFNATIAQTSEGLQGLIGPWHLRTDDSQMQNMCNQTLENRFVHSIRYA